MSVDPFKQSTRLPSIRVRNTPNDPVDNNLRTKHSSRSLRWTAAYVMLTAASMSLYEVRNAANILLRVKQLCQEHLSKWARLDALKSVVFAFPFEQCKTIVPQSAVHYHRNRTSDMDASWRDLLVLLRGNTCTSVTCDAIVELAEQNIEVLPDVFHDIVFDLLVSNATHIRSNGCVLLRKLCAVFGSLLKPLLSLSCTDGVLFTINDINVARIVECTGGQLLSTSSTSDTSSTVYTSGWLKTQVSELRNRIGLESSAVEVADAARYDNVEDFLQHTDMIEEQDHRGDTNGEAPLNPSDDFPCQLNLLSVEQTSETWFARLLRVMVVGLLSPKWEVRHGYALGLTSILDGLYPDLMQGSARLTASFPQLKYENTLPVFLCDDMLCCGICVLLLDRFMDFGGGENSSVSPVKEAAGALVACALRCTGTGTAAHKDKAWELITEMVSSSIMHWSVLLGGLIALKCFVRSNADWVLAGRPELFTSLVLRGVRGATEGQEEVSCAACEVLQALNEACALHCDLTREESANVLECLISVAAGVDEVAMAGSASALPEQPGLQSQTKWEAPSCLIKLFSAVRSLCQVTSVILRGNTPEQCGGSDAVLLSGVDMVTKLIAAQSKLVGMLLAYTDDVRQRCMQMCLETLQALEIVLDAAHMQRCLASSPSSVASELRTAHFALLGAILCASCVCSKHPCTDLQLEDTSNGPTAAEVRSQRKSAVRAAAATVSAADIDASDARSASGPGVGCFDVAARSAAYHNNDLRWRSVAKTWMKITDTLCLPLQTMQSSSLSIQQIVEHVLTCSVDIALLHTSEVPHGTEGTEGSKSAIACFASTLLACLRRDQMRDAPLPGFGSSSFVPAAGAVISIWELSSDIQQGNLTTLLAALVVGAGSDCVDRLLRAVSEMSFAKPAGVEVSSLTQSSAGLPESSVVPKKRKFVVVSDVRETAPKFTHKADIAQRERMQESTLPVAGGVSSARLTLLVNLSFLVLQIQRYAPARADAVAPVRQELLHALPVCADPSSVEHRGGLLGTLLAMDVSRVVSAACANGLAAVTDYTQWRLAATTAGVMLPLNPGTSPFNDVLAQFVSLDRTGELSHLFASATIFALVKMCGGHVHQVFAAFLEHFVNRADVHGLWWISSALSACSAAERQKILAKFNLLSSVFSSISQSYTTSDEVVDAAVAVLCLLTEGKDSAENADGGQTAVLRAIGTQLHQLLTGHASLSEGGSRSRKLIAEVFHQLVQQRLGALVHCYEVWFSTALFGIGDSDPSVRRSCVQSFRLLVPLASVAQRASAWRRDTDSVSPALPSADLLDHIFTKQSALKIQHSQRPQDVQIMAELAARTNLWVESSSSLHAAQLRAYQWEGVSWLTQLRRFGLNGILADEMGLGKSLQALTALAVQRIECGFRSVPSLIVCPATLVLHWEEEISRYFPQDLLRPVKFSATMPPELDARDVVIASYETVRRDVAKGARSTLLGRMWETVIADEAHLIKNPAAGTTRALCSLQSRHRIALSGTPLQNQVEELWSLMNFVLPDYIGDYQTFRKETVLPIQRSFSARRDLKRSAGLLKASLEKSEAPVGATEKKRRDSSLAKFHQAIEVSAVGLGLLRTLHKQVLPFILRRTKEMVAKDLPSKTIVDVLCPLSAQQSQLYEAHLRSLNITDAQMEQELKLVDTNDQTAASGLSDEIIDTELLKQNAASSAGPQSAPRFCGWGAVGALSALMPAFEEAPPAKPRRNALESLNYLKLLGVHPALVVAEGSYKTRLLTSHTSSGKLFRLANLLLESGVMTREDFSTKLSISELEVGPDGSASSEVDVEVDAGDEDIGGTDHGETEKDLCEAEDAEKTDVKVKGKRAGKGRSKDVKVGTKKDAPDSIATNAVSDHVCSTVNEDLLPPMHRCLIFAQHRAALDLVEEHVLQRYFPDVGYQRLDGSVDAVKRAAIARKFNSQARRSEPVALSGADDNTTTRAEQVQLLKGRLPAVALKSVSSNATARPLQEPDQDIRVLLLTTRACGLGLNLTAADTVIFLEHDWNPFADLQAMDRVHRLGQTHPVTVYRLLAESTVEARIMRLQGLKRNIADQVINEANAGDASSVAAEAGDNPSVGAGSRQFGAVLMQSLQHL